jgi:hypothetical protein
VVTNIHTSSLSNHHQLEEDIISLLKAQQDVGKSFFASRTRGLIRTMIKEKAPNLGWIFLKATGIA